MMDDEASAGKEEPCRLSMASLQAFKAYVLGCGEITTNDLVSLHIVNRADDLRACLVVWRDRATKTSGISTIQSIVDEMSVKLANGRVCCIWDVFPEQVLQFLRQAEEWIWESFWTEDACVE